MQSPPHYPHPTPSQLCTPGRSSGPETSAGIGCRRGWLLAQAGLPPPPTPFPCCKSFVFHVVKVYVLVLLRCFFFLFPHCTPHRGIVWGLLFFLLPSSYVMLYFSSVFLSCLPLVKLYVCCVYVRQVDG